MKRIAWLGIWLVLVVPVFAFAATTPVEASMVVIGTVTVNPDGSVKAYAIKDMDKLPPAARNVVRVMLPRWRFIPVVIGGKNATVKTAMSLRIVAHMLSAQKARVWIAEASFGCYAIDAKYSIPAACPQGTTVAYDPHEVPRMRYPLDALQAGMSGIVYLVIDVGRRGHVIQSAPRQVNLTSAPHGVDLATQPWIAPHYRRVFATAAQHWIRTWRFEVPTVGADAAKDHWIVTLAVDFNMAARGIGDQYGQWVNYYPGPVQSITWATTPDSHGRRTGDSAVAAGEALFVRDPRFVLKTPLAGNGSRS